MTAQDFRRAALAIPGAIESAHMNHPDFRVSGRVFASLDSPDVGWGMVKLTPAQQATVLRRRAAGFRAANGAWGARGYTIIFLADARSADVVAALELAAGNYAAKQPRRRAKA